MYRPTAYSIARKSTERLGNSLESLGAQLRQRRINLELSEITVAEAAGISPSYYSAIETGRRTPPTNTLERILSSLDISGEAAKAVRELAAAERGLSPDDAELPEEVQALIGDIRKAANTLQPRFTKWLRAKIREVSR